jgi:hypothetical protein
MNQSRAVAWVLVVLWVVLAVVTVQTASREATYAELLAGLDSGEITEVTLVGDFSRPRTLATVEVQWDGFPTDHHVMVDAVTRGAGGPRATGRRVLPAPVADTLRERYPELTVTTSDESAYGGNGWLGVLGLAAWVWTILLVVTTPGPLRATRWAWFWLVGVLPPVGAITFLLLGGPTGLVPEREGTRRLTGGWAFLLAFALNSVLATLLGPVLGGGLRSLS